MKPNKIPATVLIIMIAVPGSCFAYLDPGTGSMILQAIIGGVVGSIFVIKTYWSKIKRFFSKKPPKDE